MILDNPRHERFAQHVAAGVPAGRAYEQAGFEAEGPSADTCAGRLLRNVEISERVAEIKNETSEKNSMTKQQLLEYLVDVLKTPAGDVTDGHKLCQSYKHTESERSIKIPDKLRAAELMAKMCGWNEPEKVQHEAGDTLTQFLASLRKREKKREERDA